jgi:chemotaxis response regulator CheB
MNEQQSLCMHHFHSNSHQETVCVYCDVPIKEYRDSEIERLRIAFTIDNEIHMIIKGSNGVEACTLKNETEIFSSCGSCDLFYRCPMHKNDPLNNIGKCENVQHCRA